MKRAPLLLAFALCLPSPAVLAAAGAIEGRVELRLEGVALADIGPVLLYLEGEEGAARAASPGPRAQVSQKGAQFAPDLFSLGVGQTVEFANDDAILHNVFSVSKAKPFDLGLAPAGSTRSVTFDRAGVVHVYCSIHEAMNLTILVAPTPFHTTAALSGAFAIRRVHPGTYRLHAWNEKLPAPAPSLVQVVDGQAAYAVVRLGGTD